MKKFLYLVIFKVPMNEDELRMIRIVGDSMLPKLHSGDWIIIYNR